MDITRRRFLEAAAVGAAVVPALGAGDAPKIPTRPALRLKATAPAR